MRMRTTIIGIAGLILILAVIPCSVQAQKKKKHIPVQRDTLALLREFMQVSNRYKQVPLQLEVEMLRSTNFVISDEDTASLQAAFYLHASGSYVRFGEVEQLTNDSTALLVSSKLQRMILYPDAKPVLTRMKALMGPELKDSSLAALASKYKALSWTTEKGGAAIELVSRTPLAGTSRPKEVISLYYDPKTQAPLKVETLRRSLMPLDSTDYAALGGDSGIAGNLLRIEEGYYLVKEQRERFVFKTIAHEPDRKLPATIHERIHKNEQGEYVPTRGFESYGITVN